MQRSKRADAQPRVEVKYWTADASGAEEIEAWLQNEIEGEPGIVFYASFLNWCNQQVQKLGDPRAKFPSAEDKVKAATLRETLRQQPLNVGDFCGLMERYFRGPWEGGMKTGYAGDPDDAKPKYIMEADEKLRQNVWSMEERFQMWSESGETPKLSKKMGGRYERFKEAKKAEEEERELEAQRWKGMNDAMGEVEEEIEMEDTTAAMGGFAIGQQQSWMGDLTDRTRD